MPSPPLHLRRASLAALLVLSAAACESPAGGNECPSGSTGCARVEGRVIGENAQPVTGAAVTFHSAGGGGLYEFAAAFTRSDGKFRLPVVRTSTSSVDTATVWVRAELPFQVGGAPADSVQVLLNFAGPGERLTTVQQDIVVSDP